jgi:hypothetical protein
MFEGVDRPVTPEVLFPPQAVIKLKETTIKNFFINLSDYVIFALQ